MEIIMINENKLKVMLCKEDLSHFELSPEQLDYSNTETKRMFWDVLSRAKHQTGFDTDGQRVLVQLYPSKEGGCEMFVTKIGILRDNSNDNIKTYTKEKKHTVLTNSKKDFCLIKKGGETRLVNVRGKRKELCYKCGISRGKFILSDY